MLTRRVNAISSSTECGLDAVEDLIVNLARLPSLHSGEFGVGEVVAGINDEQREAERRQMARADSGTT